jgi:hypothetical protein
MRYWFYTSHKLGPDGEDVHHLGIARTPTIWAVWQDICEWVCTKVFRDRWCYVIAQPAVMAAEKRTEKLDEIQMSEDWTRRYFAWRGWSTWWVDEDEA